MVNVSHPYPHQGGTWEKQRYSCCTHSLSLEQCGGEWPALCPGCLAHGKNPWCPLIARLGGSQSWAENFGEEKNVFHLSECEPWIGQPVAYSLYWLCCAMLAAVNSYETSKTAGTKYAAARKWVYRSWLCSWDINNGGTFYYFICNLLITDVVLWRLVLWI